MSVIRSGHPASLAGGTLVAVLFGLIGIRAGCSEHAWAEPKPAESALSLNGDWTFSIHGEGKKAIQVPSTYLPVGEALLERSFELPADPASGRWLLKFGGIAMTAEVSLNGTPVGEFGPYTPFAIDVTDQVRPGENRLQVEITDLWGFAPWGREWVTAFPRMGGIIRDVSLVSKSPIYIENSRLDYELNQDFTAADCRIQTWVVNTTARSEQVEIAGTLVRDEVSQPFAIQVHAEPGISRHGLSFTVSDVQSWSPDSPRLYELELSLSRRGETLDRFQCLTGFKELTAQGRDLFLNGEKLFLKGVFRHDLYGEQGHTLTRTQMEAEIADIKSLGCNYLRLGHYPQHAYITELAARHGLLTSGEPPIFTLDQQDPKVVEGAKFCLGGLIRRDWNNPAAAFWIISNEAGTDPGYMREMVSFVRELDPGRLVTIVDHTRLTKETAPWEEYRKAGIDLICLNAYGAAFDGYYDSLEELLPDDLPFVISEWGGTSNSYGNVLREGRYYLERSSLARETGPRIAGISFWEYQDIPMRRWTEEGLLHWSLVDRFRKPYENYYALKTLYTGETFLPPRGRLLVPSAPELLPRPLGPERVERIAPYVPLDLTGVVNSDRVIEQLGAVSPLAYPEGLTLGKVAVAGLPFSLDRQVVALSSATRSVRIPVDRAAAELEFLGHVCFNSLASSPPPSPAELPFLTEGFSQVENPPPFKGYPQAGKFGEAIGEYVLNYEDGEPETIPLKNGIHFADYRLFFGFSPIDAVATATERAIAYEGDYGAKTYQMRLFSHRPAHPDKRIVEIEFRLANLDYVPLLAAITVRPEW